MPLLYTKDLLSPFWLPNGHFQSIYPALFRKVRGVTYVRERVSTPDDDFLDLDWSFGNRSNTRKLVILSHGLEGNSTRQYVLGMVRIFKPEWLRLPGLEFSGMWRRNESNRTFLS